MVKEHLNKVVEEAKKRLEIDTAQNPELRRAIFIVEGFLRKTGRVCYGGQAINAQLPQKDKFYNPTISLPDYDFFSPSAKDDVDTLVNEFREAGYTEIAKRIGIHEGTSKIFVNFISIADITELAPEFYDSIYKKSTVQYGIHYADPIFLRMMAYLELSRPRGQVERWEKVYDRINLLDKAHLIKYCRDYDTYQSNAASIVRPTIIRYMMATRRVFMGIDSNKLYINKSTMVRTRLLFNSRDPVVFLSPDANLDADALIQSTMAKKVQIIGYQNILPAMVALYHGNNLICIIVQEEACHSYIELPLTNNRKIRLASLYTLLTFYIGLYYRDEILVSHDNLLCYIKDYINLLNKYKIHPTKLFPAFPIECSGYQTTFASLLRAKGARIEAARQKLSSGNKLNLNTVKNRLRTPTLKTRRKNTY